MPFRVFGFSGRRWTRPRTFNSSRPAKVNYGVRRFLLWLQPHLRESLHPACGYAMLYFAPSPYQGRGSRVPPPDAVGGPWSPLRRRVRRHTALGAVAFRATAEAAGTTRASPPKPGLCQTREGTRFRSAENPPAGARPAVAFSSTEGDSDGPKLRRAVSGPSPSSAQVQGPQRSCAGPRGQKIRNKGYSYLQVQVSGEANRATDNQVRAARAGRGFISRGTPGSPSDGAPVQVHRSPWPSSSSHS